MQKQIIAVASGLTCLRLLAAGFDGLALQTNDWFDASFEGLAAGTKITAGSTTGITRGAGSWTAVPSEGIATNATVEGSSYLLLSTANEVLSFAPSPLAVTSGFETVTARIKYEASEDLPEIESQSGIQAAFSVITINDTLQAVGYTGGGWTNLNCLCVENLANNWFTLYIDLAYVDDVRYVRYSVCPDDGSTEILADSAGVQWFPTANKKSVESISFTGCGLVKSFSGDELMKNLVFGDAEFTYLADYSTASTVVVRVEGAVAPGTTFNLGVGGQSNEGTYDSASGTVTFYSVGTGLKIGDELSYTLSATGGTTGSGTVSSTVGSVASGWILEDAAHNNSGTWTNNDAAVELAYSNGIAEFSGEYEFTPTNAAENAVVTVENTVTFGDTADESIDIDDDSYAAVRLANSNGATVFQIYAKETAASEARWFNVYNDEVAVDPEKEYNVKSVFDFLNKTCVFQIDGKELTNSQSVARFILATGSTKMASVKFEGTGEFKSMTGSYAEAEKIIETADGGSVTVDSNWVAENLGNRTIPGARVLLDPESTTVTTHQGKSYNYFACYALGIDPENNEEAPFLSAAPDGGNIGVSLAGINVPEGVTLSIQLKSSANGTEYSNVEGAQAVAVGAPGGTTKSGTIEINPAEAGDGVKYYKTEIGIGASAK